MMDVKNDTQQRRHKWAYLGRTRSSHHNLFIISIPCASQCLLCVELDGSAWTFIDCSKARVVIAMRLRWGCDEVNRRTSEIKMGYRYSNVSSVNPVSVHNGSCRWVIDDPIPNLIAVNVNICWLLTSIIVFWIRHRCLAYACMPAYINCHSKDIIYFFIKPLPYAIRCIFHLWLGDFMLCCFVMYHSAIAYFTLFYQRQEIDSGSGRRRRKWKLTADCGWSCRLGLVFNFRLACQQISTTEVLASIKTHCYPKSSCSHKSESLWIPSPLWDLHQSSWRSGDDSFYQKN